ncbi:MAG: hypothetical protein A2X23_10340 [Chloroflexi bacterium GWC2_73_18]|nr:MAG: hypothetical protein A2X23_10340 [Chloroflexi bacterium GWC2_73_18]
MPDPSAPPATAPPDLRAAALYGAGVAPLGAGLWIGATALDVQAGLLAVAIFAGWLIGTTTTAGAWRGAARGRDRRVTLLALTAAGAAWLTAQAGGYLYQMATTPGATTTLGERIATTSILDFYAQQASPLDALALAVLLAVAAWSAR